MNKAFIARLSFAFTVVAVVSVSAAMVSCGSNEISSNDPAAPAGPTGEVALALDLSPGVAIASASYAIVGKNGFTSAGTVPVGKSADVPIPIAGIPVGMGYNIVVVANAGDGVTSCRGTGNFDVSAGSRATVIIHLVCHEPPRTGTVVANGVVNMCPQIVSLGASPDQIYLGGSTIVTVEGSDTDNGPLPLAYSWTATSGSLSSTFVANPTFTCTQAGVVTLTATVSDGDANPTCADHLTLNVTCKAAP